MTQHERTPSAYHAHIYDANADLEALRTRAEEDLGQPGIARVGRLRPRPVGPHTQPMFQIAFAPEALATMLPWLMQHRGARSVLIHPVHGDVRREHERDAMWLGAPLEINLAVFGEPQR